MDLPVSIPALLVIKDLDLDSESCSFSGLGLGLGLDLDLAVAGLNTSLAKESIK